MCSNAGERGETAAAADDLAASVAAAIDACATAAARQDGDADARLAAAWALLAGSDPDLAARMAEYNGQDE